MSTGSRQRLDLTIDHHPDHAAPAGTDHADRRSARTSKSDRRCRRLVSARRGARNLPVPARGSRRSGRRGEQRAVEFFVPIIDDAGQLPPTAAPRQHGARAAGHVVRAPRPRPAHAGAPLSSATPDRARPRPVVARSTTRCLCGRSRSPGHAIKADRQDDEDAAYRSMNPALSSWNRARTSSTANGTERLDGLPVVVLLAVAQPTEQQHQADHAFRTIMSTRNSFASGHVGSFS